MIDYALIRQILERLYAVYPATEEGIWKIDPNENKCVQHLSYLAEHGMISVPISRDKKGNYSIGRAKITSRGIDFLQPDGGLSALAAPIIRISPDSITALIDAALITRNVPADQRSVIQKSTWGCRAGGSESCCPAAH